MALGVQNSALKRRDVNCFQNGPVRCAEADLFNKFREYRIVLSLKTALLPLLTSCCRPKNEIRASSLSFGQKLSSLSVKYYRYMTPLFPLVCHRGFPSRDASAIASDSGNREGFRKRRRSSQGSAISGRIELGQES